jgi:DNA-binding MarR family transcriptional regulator
MPDTFDLVSAPGHLIRRAQQVHTTIWAEVVGSQLTSVQFAILVALDAEPGLDQRTLGERISLDPSTLAEIISRLAARGLIGRERDPGDARRYVLEPTPQGKRLLRETAPAVDEVGRRLLEGLSDRESATLLRLLRRVVGIDAGPTG